MLIFLYFLLFFSIYVVMVSENVFLTWLGLEVNVFTTLPILILGSNYSFIRAKIHVFMYFFFQTVGSLLLVAGFGLNSVEFVLVGLFVKLGIFPLNFWVPLVFSSIGWIPMFVLLVLNKVPLLYLVTFFNVGYMTWLLSLLTIAISVVALYFSFSNLKLFVCWSSIVNTGFMVMVFGCSASFGICYYLLYSVVMFFMSYFFHFSSVDYIASTEVNSSLGNQVCFISGNLVLLILAGLPLFFSWFIKILLIESFSLYSETMQEIFNFHSNTYFMLFVLNFLLIVNICAYLEFFINNILFVFSVSNNLSKLILNSLGYFLVLYLLLLCCFS